MAEQDNNRVEDGLARHGHVSYLEIPAVDVERSATFYQAVFRWHIHRRQPGQASFDDRSGALIGRWDESHAVAHEPGVLPFIYVEGIDPAVEQIVRHGGQIVKPPYPERNLLVATFRDPAGNLMGIWQAVHR
jgi:predicted enzyme related to lactoylglutathione lyase